LAVIVHFTDFAESPIEEFSATPRSNAPLKSMEYLKYDKAGSDRNQGNGYGTGC
jgi:hypothetical protein